MFGKLTYFGEQRKPVPTTTFGPPNSAAGYELFKRHHNPKVDYSNDLVGNAQAITVTPEEQTAILKNLAGVDFNDRDPSPSWSFLVVQLTATGEKSNEWLLGPVGCRR